MNPTLIFLIQFFWFLIVWITVAKLLVNPAIKNLNHNDRLTVWMAPQMLRVLGTGLLVQNLAPDLPDSFALPTAIGDSCTALLAFISVIALRRRLAFARVIAFICAIVGTLDLVIALPHSAAIKASNYLTAQWYVPAFILPLMIVCHVMAWGILLKKHHPK